ncbi:MAG: UDP-N-acetylmuramoyl-L-alanine--D-glutamate ligase, partial [Dokdonella sp.]
GKRVAIWGYGREGRAALWALRRRVPELPLTLFCSEAEVSSVRGELTIPTPPCAAQPARIEIISEPPNAAMLSAFDTVIKSPGISAYRAEILEARRNGTRFSSGTALWFAENPDARVIAVTGTKGKSTTTALIAHLLRGLGRSVALAGNIGMPLLDLLDPPQQPDWWVIELSSFQTRDAGPIEVGVINNLFDEHLDWHGNRERYTDDKLALADVARTLIVNGEQHELLARTAQHRRRVVFGASAGWHVGDAFVACGKESIVALGDVQLPGKHNAKNVCAALAAIDAAGEDAHAAARHIASFRPLPHRLQTLGERDGITWIDDSIATTPQATLQALATVADRAVTVLVGGVDRGVDWQPFVECVCARPPQAIITLGANGPRIAALLREFGFGAPLQEATTLHAAMECARAVTPIGGVILLSPGAPSFDQFRDYAERGRRFAELAGFDPEAIGQIEGLGIL